MAAPAPPPATTVPVTTLGRTSNMPVVGLGLWKAEAEVTTNAVKEAIKAGYRHLDGACDYGNEPAVGQGIKESIEEGVCTREDLFVVSKLWNTFHAGEHVEAACRRTLQDLQLDYLDLYLIHFPISLRYVDFETRYPPEWTYDPTAAEPKLEFANVPYRETWEAMEQLVHKGLVRHIGVSNLPAIMVMDVLKYATIPPVTNQIESHLLLQQQPLIDWMTSQGIVTTAYSPLGSVSYVQLGGDNGLGRGLLDDPVVAALAAKHSKTPAQVCLRWNVQRGVVIVPKSTKPGRMAENIDLFGWQLDEEDMTQLAALDRNMRFNNPAIYAGCPIFA